MNQARNDDGWYQDDQQLPPSLGVWPLGRTYVHSSDGALNTGPSPNGHSPASTNGQRASAGSNGYGAPTRDGQAPSSTERRGRPALYPVEGGYREDPWSSDQGADPDHLATPPFTGPVADGSTPLYERLALYERYGGPPPADSQAPRSGRPPLYQVGGKYRGDDWPTDPGFRRGDLGLEDFRGDSVANPGLGPGQLRPDPADDPHYGAADAAALRGPDPGNGRPRPDPAFGGPRPDRALGEPGPDPSFGGPGPRRDRSYGGPAPAYGEPRPNASFGRPAPTYGEPPLKPSFGGPDPSYGDPRGVQGSGGDSWNGQRRRDRGSAGSTYGDARRDPGLGEPHPRYEASPRQAGQDWHGASQPYTAAYAGPAPYPAPGYDDGSGQGARGNGHAPHERPRSSRRREAQAPAPAPASASGPGAGEPAGRPQHAGPRQRDPEPVSRIRPDGAGREDEREGRETWERNVTPAARVAAVEDAKLLAFIHELVQRLKTAPSVYPRLVFLVFGYAAITSLAFAYAEAIPLPITASLVVIPAAGVIYNMGRRYPDWGRRALVGWLAGIVATIIYDCLRLALVKVGIWGDPIPGIGRLVFADPHANFAWGYFWRFCGNGGGMGIAYAMLPWRGIRTGVAYGTLICTGLVGLLFFFPVAQVHFFPLTPVTTVGAYAGHWVYGAVLGKLTSWWLPPVELGRIHGRLTARLIHPGHRPRPRHASTSRTADDLRRAVRRSA